MDTCNGADEHGVVMRRNIFGVIRDLCYRCGSDLNLIVAAFLRGDALLPRPSRAGTPRKL